MKNRLFILLLLLTFIITLFNVKPVNVSASENYVVSTNGCSTGTLPTTLYLDRCSEEEIRNYYSSLNSIDESKRSGTNALQYLKDIISEMNYFTYAQVSDIYAVTDRDWVNSPAISTGNYDSSTNTVTNFSQSKEADTNPYVIMLYVDYSVESTTTLHKENGNANFDKEHVWCQSRGFKASSGAKGPAGTDLHHLIAGDSYVNQSVHNNNPYGFVSEASGSGNREATKENVKGTALHTSSSDESTTVFEPADEWKGDVARAIFYMMARYNNISGTDSITEYDPNLVIVNYATSNGSAISSSSTTPATIGTLADLLAWNKIDPVSDYEIYRNDLIYRNYQGNRNPFIDYPEWIDKIWGTVDLDGTNYNSSTTGYLDPLNDSIYGTKTNTTFKVSSSSVTLTVGESTSLYATSPSEITWEASDTSIITINTTTSNSNEKVNIKALKEGTTTITVKSLIDGEYVTKEINVTVKAKTTNPTTDDDSDKKLVIPTKYIIIGVIVFVVVIIIYILLPKKGKKKVKKAIKKASKYKNKR